MGLQTAETYKAQAAAIATALNTAFAESDGGLTGMSREILNPINSPLRDFRRWVKMDRSGTVSANDSFIDAVHPGNDLHGTIRTHDEQHEGRVVDAPTST